jgi:hypothetical protein
VDPDPDSHPDPEHCSLYWIMGHISNWCQYLSVADPGPGAPLDPGSGMGNKSRSKSLERIFGLIILKFFDADPDPGSGIRNLFDPESGIRDGKIRIRDKHPGSVTLLFRTDSWMMQIM